MQRSVQNMTSVDNCCRCTRPVVSQNVLTETQTCGWSSLFDKSIEGIGHATGTFRFPSLGQQGTAASINSLLTTAS